MGTKMAPAFANLFMGAFEDNALNNAPQRPLLWFRYIDDIFMIWLGSEEELSNFVYLHLTYSLFSLLTTYLMT